MNPLLDSPLIFDPIIQQILWGGRRLGTLLGKSIGPGNDYAESWEIADHANGRSIVCQPKEWAGKSIADLLKQHPKELKKALLSGDYRRPLILKFGNRYHLVAGNTRLCTAAALGIRPQVLIAEI